VFTSKDNKVWNELTSSVINNNATGLDGVRFLNGQFIALAETPNNFQNGLTQTTLFTSPDGVTWTQGSQLAALHISDITFGNNTYVAVGFTTSPGGGINSNVAIAATSTDLKTWSIQTLPTTGIGYYGVYFAENLFVCAGDFGSILTSPNGVAWTQQSSPTQNGMTLVGYGNGVWIVSGLQFVLSSPDAIHWTLHDLSTPTVLPSFKGVAFDGAQFKIAGGSFGAAPDQIFSSVDGSNWTLDNAGQNDAFTGICSGPQGFAAVGFNQGEEVIYTDP
jgi:hypothetical protein